MSYTDFTVPHVRASVRETNDTFPMLGPGGTYPGHGEDGAQYASDFWTTSKAVHDVVFAWLRQHAIRLNIKYIISWDRIWSVARQSEGVRHYQRDADNDGVLSPSERHTNHIHVSYVVTPYGPPAPPQPTIGVPIMAGTVRPISLSYVGDQALSPGVGYVWINKERHVTVVGGSSPGIDVVAAVEVDGLKPGDIVRLWWRREWKKDGEDNLNKGGKKGVTINGISPKQSDQVTYKDDLPKADEAKGWTACLRLMYSTNAEGAVITAREFDGWRIEE